MNTKCDDHIVELNVELLRDRSRVGQKKYGVTLEKSGLSQEQYLRHALEEVLDLANYIQGAIQAQSTIDPTVASEHGTEQLRAELLPCPFCGESKNLTVQYCEGTVIHPAYRMYCDNCGGSNGYTDRGDHVENWNRRAAIEADRKRRGEPVAYIRTISFENGEVQRDLVWASAAGDLSRYMDFVSFEPLCLPIAPQPAEPVKYERIASWTKGGIESLCVSLDIQQEQTGGGSKACAVAASLLRGIADQHFAEPVKHPSYDTDCCQGHEPESTCKCAAHDAAEPESVTKRWQDGDDGNMVSRVKAPVEPVKVPSEGWPLVEKYADAVSAYNDAVRIDVGIDKAGQECISIEMELRALLARYGRPIKPKIVVQKELVEMGLVGIRKDNHPVAHSLLTNLLKYGTIGTE